MERLVKVEAICYESYPCQHVCEIRLPDGTIERRGMDGRTIANTFWEDLPELWKPHFSGYRNPTPANEQNK